MTGPDAVGVGLIGTGGIAAHHLRAFRQHPHTRVVALCDVDPDRLAAARQLAGDGVRTYAEIDHLLADPDVSLVSICTLNALHGSQALAGLEAGKHVLVEKPVATSSAEVARLRAALATTPATCAGGMLLRFQPLYAAIRDLRAAGALGSVYLGAAGYWQRLDPAARNYAWLVRRAAAGSAMLSGGSHAVDLLRWLVGAPVVDVCAYATRAATRAFDHPPTQVGLLRFATGAVATVTVTLEAPIGHALAVELVGTAGAVRDDHLLARSDVRDTARRLPFEPPSADMACAPFGAEIADVIEAIREQRPPRAELGDVLTSHEVCLALDRAAATGRPVSLATEPAPLARTTA